MATTASAPPAPQASNEAAVLPPASGTTAQPLPSVWTLGSTVDLTLKSGSVVRGTVFAADTALGRLVIESPVKVAVSSDSSLRDTVIVNLASVVSCKTGPPGMSPHPLEPLPALTTEQASQRERLAFRACEEALLRFGPPGTTPEAQEIFDILSRTFECLWRERNIEFITIGVTMKHPFAAADITGRDQRAVQRVREMVSQIRNNRVHHQG